MINNQKSGILLHNRYKIEQKVRQKMEVKGIPVVTNYKYLGIQIDSRLTFKTHLNYIEEKIQKAYHMIKIMKFQSVDQWKILQTWIMYIVPHFRYGALI